jgi:hypothetical protein
MPPPPPLHRHHHLTITATATPPIAYENKDYIPKWNRIIFIYGKYS